VKRLRKAQQLQKANCMYIMQLLHTGFILRNAWRRHLQFMRWLSENVYPKSKHVRVLLNVAITSVSTLMELLFVNIEGECLVFEPLQGAVI
jgi:hypothetical protein